MHVVLRNKSWTYKIDLLGFRQLLFPRLLQLLHLSFVGFQLKKGQVPAH